MCSHSKSQGGRRAGGRVRGGFASAVAGGAERGAKGGQRRALIYSGSVRLQKRGEKQWDFWLKALLCILSCINLHTEFKVVK